MKGIGVPLIIILVVIGLKAAQPDKPLTPAQHRQAAIQKEINRDLDKMLNQ
ncbi:hypothetical protein [Pseudoalteromonas sp.]|uniref:hypothetical protein n=1 Tax=Pseudoalteromonas sp. TaxID=53249 RepID=UPI00262034F3|nr:hypothetical protein [Pseudoalteromonas sp.]MCP4586902.1 hypothetical protein [Pseudoalteromonas sp.]